ncbi:hypothetical protein ACFT8P_33760 [Streptomyces sp. NPDC057101]|uniref:hypothetical protein n=1 Tax=Streptomyces sp. NPDC057101 TaxID=3346020 RepID=UPI00362821A3
MQSGDLLRIGGYLVLPAPPTRAALAWTWTRWSSWPSRPRNLAEMVLGRYGPYVVVLDPDTEEVPVFTEAGAWVGTAEHPDAITDLLHTYATGTPSTRNPDQKG